MSDATIESLSGAAIASMSPQEAGAALAAFEAASRGPGPTAEPKTVAEVTARLSALTNSATFRDKLLAGDVEAAKVFDTLTSKLAAEDAAPADLAMAGILPSGIETISGNQLTTRQMADSANAMRSWGLNDECIKEALVGAKISPEIYRRALSRRAERLSDPEWTERLLAGGFAENKEYVLLSSVLAGEIVR
jgi:hypothetical protein